MRTIRIVAVAVLIVASAVALLVVQAQQAGAKRTELSDTISACPDVRSSRCESISNRDMSFPATRIQAKRSSTSSKGRGNT